MAEHLEDGCSLCSQIREKGTDLRVISRELARLNGSILPLTKDLDRLSKAHPRCAACGVLIGPQHNETELLPEPVWQPANVTRGQRRYDVCPSCYQRLHTSKRSVPQQRKYEAEQAELLGSEMETDGDE